MRLAYTTCSPRSAALRHAFQIRGASHGSLTIAPLYFLHGAPIVSSIGNAASHGCVRMKSEDAIDLGHCCRVARFPDDATVKALTA